MPRLDVAHQLHLKIVEPEAEGVFGIDAVNHRAQVALSRRQQPRPAFGRAQRALHDDRRVRHAGADVAPESIARAFTDQKVQLGAGVVAVPLGVRARRQRDFLEHVAVDHRDRAAVLDALHGVHEERRRNALEREVHVANGKAADAELAAQVVAGRDPRQHVNGAHRIVGDHAAKLLQLVAAEHLPAAGGSRVGSTRRAHVHRFRVRARSRGDRNRDLQHLAGRNLDAAACQHEIDGRHVQLAVARRDVLEHEAAVARGNRHERGVLNAHRDLFERRAVAGIHHDASERSGRLGLRMERERKRDRERNRCGQWAMGHGRSSMVHRLPVDGRHWSRLGTVQRICQLADR